MEAQRFSVGYRIPRKPQRGDTTGALLDKQVSYRVSPLPAHGAPIFQREEYSG